MQKMRSIYMYKLTRAKISMPTSSFFKSLSILALIISVVACSSDDDNTDNVNYIQFYNASSNSPAMFLSVDEDLDNDDDDEYEKTFSAVDFAEVSARTEVDAQNYYFELAWQEDDSSSRSDLTMIYQEQLTVTKNEILFLTLLGDVSEARVVSYKIPIIDDDEDDDNEQFNVQVLNVSDRGTNLGLYYSLDDETYNEAHLLTTVNDEELSDNIKLDVQQYRFYIVDLNSDTLLYESTEISLLAARQYLFAIRDSQGASTDELSIDIIRDSYLYSFETVEADSTLRFYNGLKTEIVDIEVANSSTEHSLEDVTFGSMSEELVLLSDDYQMTFISDEDESALLSNLILSVAANQSNTIFLYHSYENVDDDNDGNVDENEDGQVDEIREILSTLVVNNDLRERLYGSSVNIINLVDSDDFYNVEFFFVLSDEIIDTAETTKTVLNAGSASVELLNNTYDIVAIAQIDNNDIVVAQQTLTIDETVNNLFLILEADETSGTDYHLRVISQN